MGADPVDALRQMKNTATDPYSGGRNFAGHYSVRKWNVVPVTSPIEVQYSMAPGTAHGAEARRRQGHHHRHGGDAGTAEGDFATCLVWSSRKGNELPLLIIVTNNQWGISTPSHGQHGEKRIADRGKAFGMPTADDRRQRSRGRATASSRRRWTTCARERKPFLLEAMVSRLYGHSSASRRELRRRTRSTASRASSSASRSASCSRRAQMDEMRARYTQELLEAREARARRAAARRRDDLRPRVRATNVTSEARR